MKDTATLEWTAQWVEGSMKGETNERVIEFGKNMAMTIRAAAQSTEGDTRSAAAAADGAGDEDVAKEILRRISMDEAPFCHCESVWCPCFQVWAIPLIVQVLNAAKAAQSTPLQQSSGESPLRSSESPDSLSSTPPKNEAG